MFGLAVIVVGALYLMLLVWATAGGWRLGIDWRGKKPWLGAIIGFLIVFLPVFWDWIPTIVVHKYYCAKDSGFWVYKTLDQWKAENPGVMETLVVNKGAPSRYERFDDGHGETSTYLLNDRFNWIVTQQDFSAFLPIIRVEQQVKDVNTGEVLARYTNYGAGNSVKNTVGPPGPLKFWLHNAYCSGGEWNQGLMYSFEHSVRGAETSRVQNR